MFTKYLTVVDGKNVKGLFTSIEIPANRPIIEANGPVYAEQDLPDPTNPALLQIGPNIFMAASGHMLPDYINHSCDPNCYFHIVGNRAILYSLYVIPAHNELTFDYSSTSTDTYDKWKMNCQCGSHKCRRVISGYQYLEPALLQEYKNKGMLPLFITFPVFQKK
jgi:hypothetical protein